MKNSNHLLEKLAGVNQILMAGGKDNLKREFYHSYRDLPKVQPLVAQIGWSHNLNIFKRVQAK